MQDVNESATRIPTPVRPTARPERASRLQPQGAFDDVIRRARRYWPLLLAAVIIGLFTAWTTAALSPPTYEAVAKLMVIPVASDRPAQTTSTFQSLLTSQTVLQGVLHQLQLDQPPRNYTLSRLSSATSIREVLGANILVVKAEMGSPEDAAAVANALCANGVQLSLRLNREQSVAVRDFLKDQQDQALARLSDTENALTAFRQGAQVDVLKKDVEADMKARGDLLELEVDIVGEEARLKAAQGELARLPKVDTLNRSIQDSPALAELARTNALPPGALIGLSMKDEQTNLAYREIQRQAAESQTQLASLRRQRQELLGTRKLGAAVLPQVAALHERELEEARLTSEYNISRKVYEETKLRYQQASLDIAGRNSTMQVLDKAIPPQYPSGPHKLRAALLGALVGLILGMAFAVVRDAIMSCSDAVASPFTPAAR